ncbi:MAG: hypothetical protein IPL08_14005 [Saprospiraceae bacterium]|nr:hypothetical protein [Saprospiraceae bacterium]
MHLPSVPHEEYYYDGYNGSSTNTATIYKGKLKKKNQSLDDISPNTQWTETEYFYNSFGRLTQEVITNHNGDGEIIAYTCDMADNVTKNNISSPVPRAMESTTVKNTRTITKGGSSWIKFC